MDARQAALALSNHFAPNLTSLLLGLPEPSYDSRLRAAGAGMSPDAQLIPNAAGKVPDTDDPRVGPAAAEAFDLATMALPSGAGTKLAMAAAPMAARFGRIAKTALPADTASRLARAAEGGFFMDMPLAHGSGTAFSAFNPAKGGATTGASPGRQGVWTEVLRPGKGSPIADEFAERAAATTGGNPQVYPLVHRADKRGSIRLTGNENNHEISATLAQAWDDGFDAVMLKNYTSPGGKSGDILVVRDGKQLRVPTAQFDPAKRNSRNLLASGAGAAVVGPALADIPAYGQR